VATTFGALIQSARQHLNEIYALVTPGAPLVSQQGTTGATTYTYKIVARNATGTTEASQATTITNGNASLSVSNYNQLTWTAVPYASSYDVYRTVGGATTGKIVSATTSTTANDTGLAGGSETAPTVNTSGVTQAFWTDAELLNIATRGATDLWAAILDLHQEHFKTEDDTNVSLAAEATSLTGVPSDLFRVSVIEPRDLTTSNSQRFIKFVPLDFNHPNFEAARAMSSFDTNTQLTIYYCITGAGSPIAAPTIRVAPKISSALNLRLVYVPTLGASSLATTSNNPIPGESDNALIAWTVAFARAKEREDRSPDSAWLGVYSTEKQSLLTRLTPRQTQEPEIVEGMFESYWLGGY
jgi:hypothetical protein